MVSADPAQEQLPERVIVLPDVQPSSDFQISVLEQIASGMTDRGTALALHAPLSRVRYAIRELIIRLAAHNRAEAVFIAAKRGLLTDLD